MFILLTTAGNETTRHTISLGLADLLDAPGRARPARRRPVARRRRGRRAAAPRASRPSLPPDGDARRRAARADDPAGRQGDDLVRGRELRRGEVRRPVPARRRSRAEPPRHLRSRRPALLPRRAPREARDQDLARGDDPVPPAARAGRRAGAATLELLQRHQADAGAGGDDGRAAGSPGGSGGERDGEPTPGGRSSTTWPSRACEPCGCSTPTCTASRAARTSRSATSPASARRASNFCAAVMGTDLRHTPVVGGEIGYVDFAVRPDLSTIRRVPWQPEVAWCLGEAWTLDGSDHWPSCPRALLQRVVAAYEARGLTPIVAPELEFFLVERDRAEDGGLRRYVDELSRVYTVGAVSDPREVVLRMLLWCDELGLEAFAANHEFMNSQYEINVKHSHALDAADRAFMLKAAVKEIAAREGLLATFMGRPFADQGGSGFHLHISLADEAGAERVRGRGGRGGAQPARGELRRGDPRARVGAAGAARADRQRVQAHPPRQPRADPRQLGARQPHRDVPRPARARRPLARRDPDGRRRGVRPPDHGGAPPGGARRDRARARAARARGRRRLPDGRRARRHAAARRPRRRARRARGRRVADRAARRRSSSRRSSR